MAQPIDQPALRHDLHPGANAGHAGTKPHQTEISILKCFEYPAKCQRLHVLRASGVRSLSSHRPRHNFLLADTRPESPRPPGKSLERRS